MDFDKALEKCGNYGPYQLVVLLLFGYTNFMSSLHYYSQTLISFTPEHWCYHEQLENKTFSEIQEIYKNFSNPHCTLLEYTEDSFEKAEVGKCRKWFYKKENGYETVTTELNLVCDSTYKSAVSQSFYFLGAVVGTISFGVLADRIGRLPAICLTTFAGGLGDFLSSFVYSVEMFAVTRFISGLATDTFLMLMYILICDSAYKSAVGQSFYFLGAVIGTISFGILADRIGRLPSICLTTLTGGLGDFLSSFVNSVELFALTRFICGLATDTFFVLMYILTFEYLRPQKRTFGINIIAAIFYGTGLVLSPWFALWVKSWRYYLLIASVPVLLFLLYPLLICESASWLLTREKYDRAVKCLKRVAKFNGRQVEEKVFDEFVDYYKQKALEEQKIKNSDTFWGMFRTPRLRKFTIILLIKSIIVTMAFDIISRNVEGLGSSPFKLFSFTSVIYVPAGLTIIAFQNIIGRKGMATTSLLGGSIITAVTGFLIAYSDPNSNSTLLAIMVGLGRYGAVVAYDAEVQYCTEIVPTSVRGRAVANIHVLGYGFSFLNSYVIYLGNYYKPLPTIFISIIMLIGAALCLCLPETLNQKLPETLSDGEKFGLDEKWYYFPCFSRRKEKLVKKSVEEKFGCTNNIDITAL